MPNVFTRPYEVVPNGIQVRYWNRQLSVKLQTLLDTFQGGNFQRPGDATKMALILLMNNILFGHQYVPIGYTEDRANWGLGAREKRKSRWSAFGDDELSGPKLIEKADDHGNLTEVMTAPQPSTDSAQTHNANKPLLTHSTRVNDSVVTKRQLRRIMRKHKKDMLVLKASIQSLTLAMQTFKDRIIGRILGSLKSQGGALAHSNGEHHDDANDQQHNELGVHIYHDVIGVDKKNVTHVNDVLDDAMVGDVTLQSVDAEGDHVPQANTVVNAFA
ncbi:Uncharacterized protein TCM_046044 [Theobroma cacao]|uniref:Uncharacterized protein n=1 Tax=Theobroma cacao TaxID=3641 RepID=S1SIH4_THECC|nr:Uncharacterized protein TCM_046044 [Theobroma cacao]